MSTKSTFAHESVKQVNEYLVKTQKYCDRIKKENDDLKNLLYKLFSNFYFNVAINGYKQGEVTFIQEFYDKKKHDREGYRTGFFIGRESTEPRSVVMLSNKQMEKNLEEVYETLRKLKSYSNTF